MGVLGDLHQTVPLELGQGAVNGRSVDVAEPEFDETWDEAVSVPRLRRQEKEYCGQHEPAWRRQFESRHTFRSRRPPTPLFGGHASTILVPPFRSVNGRRQARFIEGCKRHLFTRAREWADTACSRTTPRGQDRGGHIDGD